MEKVSNSSEQGGDAFLGPSGFEDVVGDGRDGRALGLGALLAACMVVAVVFVAVPAPGSGRGIATHGAAIRCVDNTACVADGEVGDCCAGGRGDRPCCRDPTNVAAVFRTVVGACDDNSACAALGLSGACCPGGDGARLACCSARSNVARPRRAVSSLCAANARAEPKGFNIL